MNTPKRIIWSDIEIEFLVSAYKQNDKPKREDILKLIPFLEDGRTIKQIKNWFMNQRQKARKTKMELEEFRAQMSNKNRRKSNADSLKDESFSSNPNYGSLSPPTSFSPGGVVQPAPPMPLLNPLMNPFMIQPQLFNPFQPFYNPYKFFPPLYNPPTPIFPPMGHADLDQTLDFSNEKDPDSEIFNPDPFIDVE